MIARSIVLIGANVAQWFRRDRIIRAAVGHAAVVGFAGSNDCGAINGAQFVFTTPYGDWRDSNILADGKLPGRTEL